MEINKIVEDKGRTNKQPNKNIVNGQGVLTFINIINIPYIYIICQSSLVCGYFKCLIRNISEINHDRLMMTE